MSSTTCVESTDLARRARASSSGSRCWRYEGIRRGAASGQQHRPGSQGRLLPFHPCPPASIRPCDEIGGPGWVRHEESARAAPHLPHAPRVISGVAEGLSGAGLEEQEQEEELRVEGEQRAAARLVRDGEEDVGLVCFRTGRWIDRWD